MALYSVLISGQEELEAPWQDANVPNISFGYREIDISECTDNEDGTYIATYESMEIESPRTYKYLDPIEGSKEFQLGVGEYGLKPNSQRRG